MWSSSIAPVSPKFAGRDTQKAESVESLEAKFAFQKCPCRWPRRCSQITQIVIRFVAHLPRHHGARPRQTHLADDRWVCDGLRSRRAMRTCVRPAVPRATAWLRTSRVSAGCCRHPRHETPLKAVLSESRRRRECRLFVEASLRRLSYAPDASLRRGTITVGMNVRTASSF